MLPLYWGRANCSLPLVRTQPQSILHILSVAAAVLHGSSSDPYGSQHLSVAFYRKFPGPCSTWMWYFSINLGVFIFLLIRFCNFPSTVLHIFVKFIPWYLIFFDTVVNILIKFTSCFWLLYSNATEFYVFFYLHILLNSIIICNNVQIF